MPFERSRERYVLRRDGKADKTGVFGAKNGIITLLKNKVSKSPFTIDF